MAEPLPTAPFVVAGWLVDPRANELSRGGTTHRLEPKMTEVLVALAEQPGEPVTREWLMERVWPGVFVTESTLSRCVSQLRKLFEDDPHAPRVIETLSKVGYRLVAPVHPAFDGRAPGADGVAPGMAEVALSVAPGLAASPAAPVRRPWGRVGLLIGVLAVLGVGGALALGLRGRAPEPARVTPLTTTHGTESGAAPSPDGSRVVYVRGVSEGAEVNRDLYVQVIGAGSALRLTDDPAADLAPAWAPDGRQIAFVRCSRAACAIRAVSALGGDERVLLDGPIAVGLTWSSDGRTIAYAAWEPRPAPTPDAPAQPPRTSLWLLDVPTGRTRRLTTAPPGTPGDSRPLFSPDGRTVAFRRDAGGGLPDLYLVSADGGDPRPLTEDRRTLAGHTWTDDGRALVFASERNGLFQLWRVGVAGGAPALIRSVATREPGGPAVAPGGRLVFEEWGYDTDVWRVDSGAPPTALVTSTWRDTQPHVAADGRIAFASDRSGAWEVWTARPDGARPTRLTSLGGPAVLHPRWSPDGRRIAFEVRDAGRATVYVVGADGGVPRRVTPEGMDAVVPRWSRDGRALYVASRRTGRWEVWRVVPGGGGAPEQVTRAGGYAVAELPDGGLAYTKYGDYGLYVRPRAGGGERLLYPRLSTADATNWWVDGDGVVVPERGGNGARLLRIDVGTGDVTPLPVALEALGIGEATVAPVPGGGAVYTRVMRVESDLVVAEPFQGR